MISRSTISAAVPTLVSPRVSTPPATPRARGTLLSIALVFTMALLLATPATAYVVVFNDGSRIQSRDAYTVKGDQALMVLTNGTQVSYPVDQIDRAATEKANEFTYGSAVLLNDGQEVSIDESTRLPQSREQTVSDLIRERRAGLRSVDQLRRNDQPSGARAPGSNAPEDGTALLATGSVDLRSLPRTAYSKTELVEELAGAYRSRGIDQVSLFQGLSATRPMVEVVASSEPLVFRALLISAAALLELGADHPDEITGLDLSVITPEGGRAGQFNIEPDLARALTVDKTIDVQRYYIAHVQF